MLTAAVERPLGAALPAGWCENHALVANDPQLGINVILCTGCQPFDTSLWHELLQVSRSDGRTFAWKSAGRGGDGSGAGGALTQWRCEEPGRRWRPAIATAVDRTRTAPPPRPLRAERVASAVA